MKNATKTALTVMGLIGMCFGSQVAIAQSATAETSKSEVITYTVPESTNISTEVEGPDKVRRVKTKGDYKMDKRNRKVGKLKYDNCEAVESEKGASNSEVKAICTPK